MRTNQFQVPKWRNVTVFRAAAVALAIGAIAAPAVSHAEKVWDIGQYDSCVAAANNRYQSGKTDVTTWGEEIRFRCDRSGGEWTESRGVHGASSHIPDPTANATLGRGACAARSRAALTAMATGRAQRCWEPAGFVHNGSHEPGQRRARPNDGRGTAQSVGIAVAERCNLFLTQR